MRDLASRLRSFIEELKRRRVLRVAAVYTGVGWAVVEISATTFPLLSLPAWTSTLVLVLILLGFPLAVGLAWAFDVTPEGVRRTTPMRRGAARSSGSSPKGRWLLAVASIAALAGGALYLRHWLGAGAAPDGATDRVVVIPFENRTGDSSLDAIGEMAAEWISGGLEQVPEVPVVPHSVLLEVLAGVGPRGGGEGSASRLDRIAELTGAGVAVTGSYYRRANLLELHAEVVDLASRRSLAAVSPVTTSAEDPVRGIDSVRIQVMGGLAARLSPLTGWELPPGTRPPTFEAYRAYSAGIQAWNALDYVSAARSFEEAYARDTTYVRALMMAVSAYGNAGLNSLGDSLRAMLWDRRDALSPYDRHRLAWMAARRSGDLATALAEARAGAELNPTGTMRAGLVLSLTDDNRPREALDNLQDLLARIPETTTRWYPLWTAYADLLHQAGRHERELEIVQGARQRVSAGTLPLLRAEANALAALGDTGSLRGVVLEMEEVPDSGLATGFSLSEVAAELRAHGRRETSFEVVDAALLWLADRPAEMRRLMDGQELRALLLYQRERWADAAATLDSALTPSADTTDLVTLLGMRGEAAARSGDKEEALSVDRRLAGFKTPLRSREATLQRARIAAILGERDDAVALLSRAFAAGYPYGIWIHRDMDLEPLRGFEPFERLVRPKG